MIQTIIELKGEKFRHLSIAAVVCATRAVQRVPPVTITTISATWLSFIRRQWRHISLYVVLFTSTATTVKFRAKTSQACPFLHQTQKFMRNHEGGDVYVKHTVGTLQEPNWTKLFFWVSQNRLHGSGTNRPCFVEEIRGHLNLVSGLLPLLPALPTRKPKLPTNNR